MALHSETGSMIKEALKEMLEVSEYCINFDKGSDSRWVGQIGCYGYPSAVLLLCIVDSVGTLIEGGGDDISQHFKILNNHKYYNLNLSDLELKLMEKKFRNRLTHNSYMEPGLVLNIGTNSDKVLEKNGEYSFLNLKPFLKISKEVVNKIIIESL